MINNTKKVTSAVRIIGWLAKNKRISKVKTSSVFVTAKSIPPWGASTVRVELGSQQRLEPTQWECTWRTLLLSGVVQLIEAPKRAGRGRNAGGGLRASHSQAWVYRSTCVDSDAVCALRESVSSHTMRAPQVGAAFTTLSFHCLNLLLKSNYIVLRYYKHFK